MSSEPEGTSDPVTPSAPTLTSASAEAEDRIGSVTAMLLEGSDGLLWGVLLDSAASVGLMAMLPLTDGSGTVGPLDAATSTDAVGAAARVPLAKSRPIEPDASGAVDRLHVEVAASSDRPAVERTVALEATSSPVDSAASVGLIVMLPLSDKPPTGPVPVESESPVAFPARAGVAPCTPDRSSPAPDPAVPAMSVAPHVVTGPALLADSDAAALSVTRAMLLMAVAPDTVCVTPASELEPDSAVADVWIVSVVWGHVSGIVPLAAAALGL
mmetsp:Transcript_4744/g.10526  ORF Transcript_4744/g.10526 Transcript_4744/m.10526 type:complete len:270 (-) Transcript_4744:735-1544(-)